MIKNKGFTLIELLIVFAVIGLLAGIILASVKSFQDRASIAKTIQYSKSVDNLLAADAVGIWNFDDQTNPTKDTSGWANHGTINGATFTTDTPHKAAGAGAGKYALSFDGSNDYVDCGNAASLNITNAITIGVWVKLQSTGSFQALVDKNWSNGYAILIQDENRSIRGYYSGGGAPNYYAVTATGAFNWGEWAHIVYTFTISSAKIYVNGALKTSKTPEGNIALNPAVNLRIGYSSSYPVNGLIDEVRIFSRALSQTEIRKLYAEGAAGHGIVLK